MKWFGCLLLALAVFLAGCGGGGGGSGGGTQTEPSVTLNNLYGTGKALPREGFLIFDVSNLTLEQDEYIGLVDGYLEVTLLRLEDGSLGAILPFDFPAGEHVLTLTVGDEQFEIPFETLASEVASRSESLAGLEVTFTELRSVLDEAIALKTSAGAPQEEIDELVAQRAALDTTSPDFALASDAELDHFNKMLALLMEEEPATRRATRSTLTDVLPDCGRVLSEYKRSLARVLILIGGAGYIGYAASSGIGAAFGAAFGAMLVLKSRSLSYAVVDTWYACVQPVIDELTGEINSEIQSSQFSARASRSIPVNDSEQAFDYIVEIPYTYSLKTKFDGPLQFISTFSSIRKIVSTLAIFIPDEAKSFISERMGEEEYRETPPSGLVSVEAVDHPGISVEVTPVDEESFTLTFHASPGVDRETEFSFVLYNQEHQLKTRFRATLEVPEHCPVVHAFDATLISESNRCLVIAPASYREYRWGQPLLEEDYGSGTFSLSSMKGLQEYPQLDGILVSQYPHSRMEFTDPMVVGEYWQTVPVQSLAYFPDGAVQRITEYTDPFTVPGGGYASVPAEQRDYHESGPLAGRTLFSLPQRNADGDWVSVPQQRWRYREDTSLSSETTYSAPLQDGNGVWTSVESVIEDYGSDGLLDARQQMSAPRQTSDGNWVAVLASYSQWSDTGLLRLQSDYFDPLPTSDGGWQSFVESTLEYSEGVLLLEQLYFEPDLVPGYGYATELAVKRQYHEDGVTERRVEFYLLPALPTRSGDWKSTLKTMLEYYPGGELEQEVAYSDPLETDSGDWVSVDVMRKVYREDGSRVSEVTFAAPTQLADGYWISLLQQEKNYHDNDELSTSLEFFPPVETAPGVWQTGYSERNYYDWSGNLQEQVVYTKPPLQAGVAVVSVPATRTLYHPTGGIWQLTTYSSPLVSSSAGESFWSSVRETHEERDAGGAIMFIESYQAYQNQGIWESYRSRVDFYQDDFATVPCYITYNQQGGHLVNTCSP